MESVTEQSTSHMFKYLSVGVLKRMNKVQLVQYIVDNGHPDFDPEKKHNKSQLVTKCLEVQKLKKLAINSEAPIKEEVLDYGIEGGMTFEAETLHPDEITMIEIEEQKTISDKDKDLINYYKGELSVALEERDQADAKVMELSQVSDHDAQVWKNRYNKLMVAYKKILQTNIDLSKELAIVEQIV